MPGVANVDIRTILPRCVASKSDHSYYGIQTDEGNHVSTDMFIGEIQKKHIPRGWQVALSLNIHKMIFKIDTGAQCNVIIKQYYVLSSIQNYLTKVHC